MLNLTATMADTIAFPYERLPPELREEIVLHANDARTLAAMRAASTLLRDDVDRVHPDFSSIQGHDIISGLASACEQMAAPRTIEAIIRSLPPSAVVRDPQDESVIVRTEWSLPEQFFVHLGNTAPSGSMRCMSLLERKLISHRFSRFSAAVDPHWIFAATRSASGRPTLDIIFRPR